MRTLKRMLPDAICKGCDKKLRWRTWDGKQTDYCTKCRDTPMRKDPLTRSKHYGLTEFELAAMFRRQNGECGICETQLTYVTMRIDHDHATGEVRGLLCSGCNAGLGLLGDDRNGLLKALQYLGVSSDRP